MKKIYNHFQEKPIRWTLVPIVIYAILKLIVEL